MAERVLVEEHYPDLAFRVEPDSGVMCLTGNFTLRADCGVSTEILVRIVFPIDYPDSEPVAYDAVGRFPLSDDRHIVAGGRFCLWLPPCSRWYKDDPKRLVRFLDEVTVFLERQLVYDVTGVWPGAQYKHGAEGYEEFMLSVLGGREDYLRIFVPVISGQEHPRRNSLCLCASGKKYKRCHAQAIEEIMVRVGRNTLYLLYKGPRLRNNAPTS